MMKEGLPKTALSGPLLVEASFPDILVAKAYSIDGKQLDLVLYNGKAAGEFTLGLERLTPGATYSGQTGQSFVASAKGTGCLVVKVDGRTQIIIRPVA